MAEPEEGLQLPAMPQLLGHDRVPNWCLDFLQGWADTQGQWTVVPEQWTRFTDAMVAALDRSDHAFLDSFKGRIFDLVEEVTWRDEDDYEVVQKVLDELYQVLKHYVVVQPARALQGPVLPHEQLHQWEAQYGMLPIWMTTRDHTLRDGSHSVASSRIQERLHGAEAEVAAEEFQWSPLRWQYPGSISLKLATSWCSFLGTGGRMTSRLTFIGSPAVDDEPSIQCAWTSVWTRRSVICLTLVRSRFGSTDLPLGK